MSGNVLEYVRWRGDLSFEQDKFNAVDALVLAEIIYNKIENLFPDDFNYSLTLEEIVERFMNSKDFTERSNLGYLINPENLNLLFVCAKSKRFGKLHVCGVKSILNEENCEQFAAACFLFGKNVAIVLRGTDDYIISWKEDFNISYMNPIPAQKDALEYVNNAGEFFKRKRIYVTGHSKGGNLALYSGVKANLNVKRRIKGIYNLDGPGFSKDFFNSLEYKLVQNKVVTVFPEHDIVGMFFKHGKDYQIIKSCGKGIRQHDGMTWQILGKEFTPGEDFTSESKFFYKSFNEWADKLSDEDKKILSDSLFDVFLASDYKTVLELTKNPIASTTKMIAKYASFDQNTKGNIKRIINELKKVLQDEIPIFNFVKN